jgi:hypothetical protein
MTEDNEDFNEFQKTFLYERLLYLKSCKLLGVSVDNDEIGSLEIEVYPELKETSNDVKNKLGSRELDELRILLFSAEPQFPLVNAAIKARVIRMGHTLIRMRGDNNHQRPHFHIEYKREYSASYAIDTLERLAGQMPPKYEEKLLVWAGHNQNLLLEIWDSLKKGNDITDLLLEAQEFG